MSNNTFEYMYSAKDQEEIKKIRKKYVTQSKVEDKMTRLRRLDASVTKTANTVSIILGVVGSLVLGFGMSLFMSDLGQNLGLNVNSSMVWGVGIGIVGAVIVSIAYPVYNIVVKNKRKQLAPEIVRLTDELMK